MWKYFTKKDTLTYHDVLSDLVWSYNHTYHRSIKMQPAAVNFDNQETVWQHLYAPRRYQKSQASRAFREGQHVRISKAKRTFKKGCLPNWTREIFTVVARRRGSPAVYVLQDDAGDQLEGTFYAEELQAVVVAKDKLYKIETILNERRKGRRTQVLIKWAGYPSSFNGWLNKAELKKYKG